MMIKTRLMPPTAPATVPTVRINATGSVDFDATDSMKKKNISAKTMRTRPAITIRQFLRRIAAYSDRKNESLQPNVRDARAWHSTFESIKLRNTIPRSGPDLILTGFSSPYVCLKSLCTLCARLVYHRAQILLVEDR